MSAPIVDSALTLETERLILRLPRREDFEPFAEFMADAEATAFLGGQQLRSVAWPRAEWLARRARTA
jgi:RimJ/RimL family protein N-acetyltransferase